MSTRSLVLLSFVASAFTFAPSVRADVPNPSSSSGTTTTTSSGSTSTGAGGSSTNNPNCTIDVEQQDGRTCQTCNPSSTCGSLSSDYSMVCQQSSTVQIWCNGPNENVAPDQNTTGCSVAAPGTWTGAAAAGALAIAAAMFLRRSRRGTR
jgi:hypothetical protein